jgi:hypothetical protein
VDAVHEGGVVAHLRRQRPEQVPNALLVLHVHVEVADQHDGAVGADALLATAELAGLHVALHDVDAVLLVEGDARDLVEADHVVLADQPALAGGVVDEHLRHRRLAARDQMRVGRDLLEQVALAGAPRPELHQVVVALDERDHAQQEGVLGAGRTVRAPARHCVEESLSTLAVVSAARALLSTSSTSRLESWIARSASTPKGRPCASCAMAES